MSSINKYNVLITPTSATTTTYVKKDAQGRLWIGTGAGNQRVICQYSQVNLGSFRKNVSTAEVLQVSTLTFTGTANATKYSASFLQYDTVNRTWIYNSYDITTPVTGTVTATTIATQFKNRLAADPNLKVTVAQAAGVLTVTAVTGYPIYTFAPTDLGGGFVYVVTTAGVVSYGRAPFAAMAKVGINVDDVPASTAGYTGYSFMCSPELQGQNGVTDSDRIEVNMFINLDGAQAAALITAIDALFV